MLVLIGLITVSSSPAQATDPVLRKAAGNWLYGPETVWTDGNAGGSYLFHPMSEVLSANSLHYVRIAYQLSQDSGSCQLRPAVRFSNDGSEWDAAKEIHATWQNGNGVSYDSAFVDLMNLAGTDSKAWIQFGVQTDNDVGVSTTQFCKATIRVELSR